MCVCVCVCVCVFDGLERSMYVCVCFFGRRGRGLIVTSAVLGTLSQNTSILMSPRVVCNVTDMVSLATASHRLGNTVAGCRWNLILCLYGVAREESLEAH